MKKRGNIIFTVLLLLGFLTTVALALGSIILSTNIKIQKAYLRLSALAYAEAGINRSLWEINNNNLTFAYSGSANFDSTKWVQDTSLTGGEFKMQVTNCPGTDGSSCRQITSVGAVPSFAHAITERTVKIKINGVSSTTNLNFNYSAQSNANQVQMGNGSVVKGSVYSNGPIYMGSKAKITGNATSSGSNPATSLITKTNGNNPSVAGTAKAFAITNVDAGAKVTGAFPALQAMPIADTELNPTIDAWEAAAAGGGVLPSQTLSGSNQLGPVEINGDLIINGDLQINGTIWVNGNITINGGSHLYLNPNFGNNGAVIIADYKADRTSEGKITVGNGVYISGTQKLNPKTTSFTMLFSTFTNTASNWNTAFALELTDPNVQGGVYYAPFGSFHLKNNGQIRAVAASGLVLDNNVVLDYDANWGNSGISNGPAGKWTITEWQIMY